MVIKRIMLGIFSCSLLAGLYACEGERTEPTGDQMNQEAQQTQQGQQGLQGQQQQGQQAQQPAGDVGGQTDTQE